MSKNFLKDCVKVFTGGATVISYISFYKNLKDQSLNEKVNQLQAAKDELAVKLNNHQFNEVHNELVKVKVESFKDKLAEVSKNGEHEIEILRKINPNDPNALSDIKHHVSNFTKDTQKGNEILDKIIDILTPKNNIIADSTNPIKDIINNFSDMLSTLSTTELGALTHLLSAVFILLCLFTIIVIVYSDFLLSYFKLEEKYPRLGRFLKIRKMFQQYYLFLNFLLIIITLLAIIFINIQILFFL